jgi:hypothetical protein
MDRAFLVGEQQAATTAAYLADFLGLGVDMFYRPAHASVHRILAKDERRVILSLNEHRHLADAGVLTF